MCIGSSVVRCLERNWGHHNITGAADILARARRKEDDRVASTCAAGWWTCDAYAADDSDDSEVDD